jgi:hypothetical protein
MPTLRRPLRVSWPNAHRRSPPRSWLGSRTTGWGPDKLTRLRAGLREVLPWVRQRRKALFFPGYGIVCPFDWLLIHFEKDWKVS